MSNPELRIILMLQIEPPPHQLREKIDPVQLRELADSLARDGLLEPIGVQTQPQGGPFRIIYGHRRYLAAQLLAWASIAALIFDEHADALQLALAENTHRANLTPVEEAMALGALASRGLALAAIAHQVRKTETWCQARLALLKYPQDLLDAIHDHRLPLTVAAQLLAITHEPYRAYLTRDALAHGASARTVAAWVQHYLAEQPRIESNMEAVEAVAARRSTFVIMSPCDYCQEPANIEATRTFRLCPTCSAALSAARNGQP